MVLVKQIFLIIALLLCGVYAHAITYVQGNTNSLTGTAITVLLPSSVTSGSALIASLSATSSTGVTSISGCGATWYPISTLVGKPGVWWAQNVPSGLCTVLVTTASSVAMALAVSEEQGLSSTFAMETYATVVGTNSPVNMSLTSTGTSDLIYSV